MQTDYLYKISDGDKTYSGMVKAISYENAANLVKKEGHFILELREKGGGFWEKILGKREKKFSGVEKINFTDHLGSMMSAGTPIRDALDAYSDGSEEKNEISESISQDIEHGKTLSEAISRFPDTFSTMYTSLVRAGERSGSLDETLEYLGNELRRDYEFKQKVKSSMYYPALVLLLSIGVIAMVVTVVLPRVVEVSKSFGGDMPALTRVIVSISEFISKYGLYLFGLFIVSLFFLYRLYKSPKTSQAFSRKLLNMPIIGNLIKEYSLARFFRILGSSVKYGVPIVDSLESSLAVVQNEDYREALKRIKNRVAKGATISESISFEDKKLFPGLIVRTLRGAERTGSLDKAAIRLSLSYELGVDRDLKKLTTFIEPAMIIFLGLIVALIAISVITPIYQLTTRVGV